MSQTPANDRDRFPGISSRAWEHPSDRTALSALRRLKGFDQVLKLTSGMLRERQHRLLYLASAARVGPRQFPDLDALLDECVEVLDAQLKPELFVLQSPVADAFTIGMDRPFIVIGSGLYDLMTHDEMRFVVGHELGHALSGHAVYRTMMMHLMRLARSFGVVPIGGWALRAIVAALMEWQRKSELSGDRAGLLCCQDVDAAIRVEMKLAGGNRLDKLDSEAFLAQAREYEKTGDMRDGLLKLLNLELQAHPFSVLRAAALTGWVDSGGYGKVMSGDYPRRVDDDRARFSEDVGEAARHYKDGFDQSDDPLIRGIRDGLGGIRDGLDGVGRAATGAVDSLGRKITEWRHSPK
jgi:Zn-dependent protease with chaperone function